MKTIFNTCVEVTSQEQANRLRQVCIDNGLSIWWDFDFLKGNQEFRYFNFYEGDFCNWLFPDFDTIITESEWMELLEQHNKTKYMYTLTQEQVEELAKGKLIQEVIPEAFKLEVGKWYKYNGCLLNYQGLKNGIIIAYGFINGLWSEDWSCGQNPEQWFLATREEVEAMLIAEAKKRGFVEGANVKSKYYPNGCTLSSEKWGGFDFWINNNILWHGTDQSRGPEIIFNNGQWAEIVPESKSDILTELIDYATTNDNIWLKNQLEKLR